MRTIPLPQSQRARSNTTSTVGLPSWLALRGVGVTAIAQAATQALLMSTGLPDATVLPVSRLASGLCGSSTSNVAREGTTRRI